MFIQVRDQFLSIWKRQSSVQRIVIIALVVSAIIMIPLFITWANTPTYSVAFSGLSEADAGEIVAKLDELAVPYQISGSGTIKVPSDQVYETRLRMAREGLPAGGNVGFEVFSGNTLGMTEFTQRVNYQRALEGELERTIGSLSAVEAVRVHVVTPEKTLLADQQSPTTASITIQEKAGSHLDAAQVSAITHLVASSVEGMKSENVVVIDVNGNLLATGATDGQMQTSAQSDGHRAVEINAGNDLKKKVQSILDTALGPNRSVVQAGVTMDWTERQTTTQAFDPLSNVVRSSQTISEVYTTTGGVVGGIPGAATNLPTVSNTTSSSSGQQLNYQKNEHTVNYEITQSESTTVQPAGDIQRITLSVLVDGVTNTVQLEALKSVIGAAAGISVDRGDVLAVESLAFDRTYFQEQAADLTSSERNDLYWKVGQAVAAGLLLIALLWYVQRLLSNLRLVSSQAWTPVMKPVADMALPQPMMAMSESMSVPPPPLMPEPIILPEPKIDVPALSAEDEQMQKIITRLAEENPSSVAEIIQMWLSEDEK